MKATESDIRDLYIAIRDSFPNKSLLRTLANGIAHSKGIDRPRQIQGGFQESAIAMIMHTQNPTINYSAIHHDLAVIFQKDFDSINDNIGKFEQYFWRPTGKDRIWCIRDTRWANLVHQKLADVYSVINSPAMDRNQFDKLFLDALDKEGIDPSLINNIHQQALGDAAIVLVAGLHGVALRMHIGEPLRMIMSVGRDRESKVGLYFSSQGNGGATVANISMNGFDADITNSTCLQEDQSECINSNGQLSTDCFVSLQRNHEGQLVIHASR